MDSHRLLQIPGHTRPGLEGGHGRSRSLTSRCDDIEQMRLPIRSRLPQLVARTNRFQTCAMRPSTAGWLSASSPSCPTYWRWGAVRRDNGPLALQLGCGLDVDVVGDRRSTLVSGAHNTIVVDGGWRRRPGGPWPDDVPPRLQARRRRIDARRSTLAAQRSTAQQLRPASAEDTMRLASGSTSAGAVSWLIPKEHKRKCTGAPAGSIRRSRSPRTLGCDCPCKWVAGGASCSRHSR